MEGVPFSGFQQALMKYGVPVPEPVAREIFNRMDVNGDGTIQQAEFVDVVMTRWKPSVTSGHAAAAKARQDTSSKTLIANDGGKMVTAVAKYRGVPELRFALGLLILKIVGGLKSGSHGVMRMWQEFRSKCCASSDGVVLAEFEHGLKMYGIDVSKDLALKMFQKIDNNGSGNIQIFEFIDNLMGRWSADYNSIQAIGVEEERALLRLSKEIAEKKLKKAAFLERQKDAEVQENQKLLAKVRTKQVVKRSPIWMKKTKAQLAAERKRPLSRNLAEGVQPTTVSARSKMLISPIARSESARVEKEKGNRLSLPGLGSPTPSTGTTSTRFTRSTNSGTSFGDWQDISAPSAIQLFQMQAQDSQKKQQLSASLRR